MISHTSREYGAVGAVEGMVDRRSSSGALYLDACDDEAGQQRAQLAIVLCADDERTAHLERSSRSSDVRSSRLSASTSSGTSRNPLASIAPSGSWGPSAASAGAVWRRLECTELAEVGAAGGTGASGANSGCPAREPRQRSRHRPGRSPTSRPWRHLPEPARLRWRRARRPSGSTPRASGSALSPQPGQSKRSARPRRLRDPLRERPERSVRRDVLVQGRAADDDAGGRADGSVGKGRVPTMRRARSETIGYVRSCRHL